MKISLITVTYNSGKTLSDTIQSVLSQSYTNIEYIIIDGLSQDNTIDVIKKYELDFEGRMMWISEKDRGLYDAMNKGIKMATGDVVGILNSDAVYGDVHFVKDSDLHKCVRYYSSKIFQRSLMRLGFMPAHPSFYLRREYFEELGLYQTDYKIAADFEFLLRVIYKAKIRMKYLPVDMVTMRVGGASTSGFESHKRIMKEHLRAFRENGIYANVFLLSLRYIYKIGEIISNRVFSHRILK